MGTPPSAGSGRPSWLATVLAIIVALGAGAGISVAVTDDGPDGKHTRTIHIGGKVNTPGEQQLAVTPPKADFDAPADTPKADAAPAPAATAPPAVAKKILRDPQDDTYDTSGVLRGAAAKPARRNCYTTMNGGLRSFSSIRYMVAHVTVSVNALGTRDGDALCDFFRRVQASPNWTVDNEGNSWENVPLNRVPWTQAWYNRVSCSIEYVGSTGRAGEGPAQWTDVQLREGGRLFAKCAKAAGIPIQNGTLAGRAGLITHQELGLKGGGHTDPGPFWNRSRQLYWIRYYSRPAVTNGDRSDCKLVAAYRDRRRRHLKPTASGKASFERRLARVKSHGYRCVDGKVKHR